METFKSRKNYETLNNNRIFEKIYYGIDLEDVRTFTDQTSQRGVEKTK